MTVILSIIALLLVAVTMGMALAHVLEFPGKLRLDEAAYRSAQTIYYPGFTIGALVGEFGSLMLLPVLLLLMSPENEGFWWIAAAFLFLLMGHAAYWLVTHPVNHVWLKGTRLSGAGSLFFSSSKGAEADWKQLRDTWEYSHAARAFLFLAALAAMAVALTRVGTP